MKMHNSDQVDADILALGSNVEQFTMGVKVSAKVFSMNVDGIYQDKYGSTVRELSTNALDIHKTCGIIDKPFDIHVPSAISGKFIVRDYGCGLNKHDVIEFFANLFSSSKDQDNESVGFFGIGCKSPFTVTDDFLVISRHQGVKTTYSFTRENKGTPRCIVLSSVECDEPSGIEIVIDSGDTDTWLTAIRNQLIMFPTKPNVYMDGELIDPKFHELTKVGDVYIGSGLPKSVYICQGGVIYPVDTDQFPQVAFMKPRLSGGFIIYSCEIGMITPPPDRERIEISDQNAANLAIITKAAKESITEAVKEIYLAEYTGSHQSYTSIRKKLYNLVDIDQYIGDIHTNAAFTDVMKKMTGEYHSFVRAYKTPIDALSNEFCIGRAGKYHSENGRYNRMRSPSIESMFTDDNLLDIFVLNGKMTISSVHDQFSRTKRGVYIIRTKKGCGVEVLKMLNMLNEYFGSTVNINYLTSEKDANKQLSLKVTTHQPKHVDDFINTQFMTLTKRNISWGGHNYVFTSTTVSKEDMEKGDYYLLSANNYSDNELYHHTYLKMADVYNLMDKLDKPLYFMRNKYHRLMKRGILCKIDDIVSNLKNHISVGYIDLVFGMGIKWSNAFYELNKEHTDLAFVGKDTFDEVCVAVKIDPKQTSYLLSDVIEKIDIKSNLDISHDLHRVMGKIKINKSELKKIATELNVG